MAGGARQADRLFLNRQIEIIAVGARRRPEGQGAQFLVAVPHIDPAEAGEIFLDSSLHGARSRSMRPGGSSSGSRKATPWQEPP